MQQLVAWDKSLLKLINSQWHHPFFDSVLPFLRIAEFWVPLYIFLIAVVLINVPKNGKWWVLFAAITAIITNFISSDIIKENIKRLRPCNDALNASWFRVLEHFSFPQSSSFTSSHAANHFGIAMFIYITTPHLFGKWRYVFFAWAASICYTQMYVGVHYPLDILAGSIIGLLIGSITGKIFNSKFKILNIA
jgi:undecaprenyl-diphosphatase